MLILLCGNEKWCDELKKGLHMKLNAEIKSCFSEKDCVRYCQEEKVGVLLLAADVPEIDFADVLKQTQFMKPNTKIFLVCIQSEADGHFAGEICDKFLLNLMKREVTVKTFGGFDIMLNGITVVFHNAKAKELFALCVDKEGSQVSMADAIEKLWPNRVQDKGTERLYRKAVNAIQKTLEEYGIANIFYRVKGGCGIHTVLVKCDLYSFLENPSSFSEAMLGQYMPMYSWAEETAGRIAMLAQEVSENSTMSYFRRLH